MLMPCRDAGVPRHTIEQLISAAIGDPTPERLDAVLTNVYGNSLATLYVMMEDGRAVGVVGIRRTGPDAAEILHIAVAEKCRRQGLGRRMVWEVCALEEFAQIAAQTDRDAVQFYERCGFSIESLGELYPGTERFRCSLRARMADDR